MSWSRPRRRRSTAEQSAIVRSARNPRVAEAIRLHRSRHRTGTGRALLEGPHLFGEALSAGAPLERVFCLSGDGATRRLAGEAGLETVLVSQGVLERLATTVQPQSPVVVAPIPSPVVPREGHLLVAWGISDPGNAGTLIRIAAAFGLGFVSGPDTADPWAPKTLRSGAGAHFHTSIGRVSTPEDLRALQRPLLAAVAAGGVSPARVRSTGDVALLVGSESEGLPGWLVAAADELVTIPMPGGTESLNAAVAGAILAYEVTGARFPGQGGAPPTRD